LKLPPKKCVKRGNRGDGSGAALAGDEAFSLQGNAAESADFKSQTFGALVVHLNDNSEVQAAQTQLNTVLRDVEGDGYFEQTQTVAAKDSAGNLQAVLTLDFNGDGVPDNRAPVFAANDPFFRSAA
jgi:hypothetical protein